MRRPLFVFPAAFLLFLPCSNVAAELVSQHPLGSELNAADSCHTACTALVSKLVNNVFHGAIPSDFAKQYHFAQAQEVVPACIIQPNSTNDVSQALKIITRHDCPFAIKSGGHSFTGASSIYQGIIIDLRFLNKIQLTDDKLSVFLGPGSRWHDVYDALAPMNLTVSGGRDNRVGVGGFILGELSTDVLVGGISFLARRSGWAADTVKSYEVVLANGSISIVNQLSHPDLFFALRGGGSNFGIVTQFEMETFPDNGAWGGFSLCLLDGMEVRKKELNLENRFDWTFGWFLETAAAVVNNLACRFGYCTTFDTLLQAMEKFHEEGLSDPYAAFFFSAMMIPGTGRFSAGFETAYTKPQVDPPVFKDFKAIPTVYSTNRLSNIRGISSDLTKLSIPDGKRQLQGLFMLRYDSTLISKILDIMTKETYSLRRLSGFGVSFGVQFITLDEITHFGKNGGNAFGLTAEDGPLTMIYFPWLWNSKADDATINRAVNRVIGKSTALAKEMKVFHSFKYLNYARIGQDVFGSYSVENRKRLLEIQKKHDPDGVFTRLQPGGFKLQGQGNEIEDGEEEFEGYISKFTPGIELE